MIQLTHYIINRQANIPLTYPNFNYTNRKRNIMNSIKIAFTTLGCKVNLYDTEAMIELFEQEHYEVVNFDDYADIYVINTCTVTNLGDKKSRQMIRRAKTKNENAIIVATGCYAQVAPNEVAKVDGINIIVGTKNRLEIVQTIQNYINSQSTNVLNTVSDIMKERTFEPLSISTLKNRTRAYLKIQEGCNKFCTYCIIPFARGPIRSRLPEDIVKEVQSLANNGFKEVVLTGIHILSYGDDLKTTNLIDIVKRVHSVDKIERIRFSSIEPLVITDEFIQEIKKLPKVCDHYHLSLQSGSDRILQKMNRKYTTDEYADAVIKLRTNFPDVAITTDIIVGFPTESDEEFIETCDFVKKIALSQIHSFPYSPKKGTKAALFDGQIKNYVKSLRSKSMIKISSELNLDFLNKMINKTMPVLFERNKDNDTYEGHTTNYISVIVHSPTNIVNCIKNVKMIKIIDGYIFGELL